MNYRAADERTKEVDQQLQGLARENSSLRTELEAAKQQAVNLVEEKKVLIAGSEGGGRGEI